MSDTQATQLVVFVLALGAAMGGLVVFTLYLAKHPPPKRWRLYTRGEDEDAEDENPS